MSRTARSLTLAVTAALLAVLLQAPVPTALAATKTFTPPTKQDYIVSTTVRSTPTRWRFEIRTARMDDAVNFQWAIDTPGPHTHAGAEYRLTYDGGQVRLRRLPHVSDAGSYLSPCPGTKRGLLPVEDGVPTGVWVSLPQDCLTYYATDDARLTKLRVRSVVRGIDSTSYSPGKGGNKFHAAVPNHPAALG
ncbi:MAG: hypothetical protein Q7T56_20135 [Nocardioidaceae bacterium]|nr:hypothetical protein [Nocardioidaceae bacterium]